MNFWPNDIVPSPPTTISPSRSSSAEVGDARVRDIVDLLAAVRQLDRVGERVGAVATSRAWCRRARQAGDRLRREIDVALPRTCPAKPSSMPTTSQPSVPRACSTTARMTALSPGQSPPPVRMPIRLAMRALVHRATSGHRVSIAHAAHGWTQGRSLRHPRLRRHRDAPVPRRRDAACTATASSTNERRGAAARCEGSWRAALPLRGSSRQLVWMAGHLRRWRGGIVKSCGSPGLA